MHETSDERSAGINIFKSAFEFKKNNKPSTKVIYIWKVHRYDYPIRYNNIKWSIIHANEVKTGGSSFKRNKRSS